MASAETQHALDRAAQVGVHAIPLPTPFASGDINTYLIDDDPLTLVDCGPNFGRALDALEQGLGALGRRVEDLQLLVATHPHMDHTGLAEIIVRRSGAEVAALDASTPYVEDFAGETLADNAFLQRLMVRHGVHADVAAALRVLADSGCAWGSSVRVTRPLTRGEHLALRDRTLRILHRPGHCPTDTVLVDDERALAFTGDHLMQHISANALMTRPAGSARDYAGERPRPLLGMLDSLRATRAMAIDLALAGHGDPITDHTATVDERLAGHTQRAYRIWRLIAEAPMTAHEIARGLYGGAAVTEAYLTLSQVLGHLDLLLAGGVAAEREARGVVRFAATEDVVDGRLPA